MEYNTLNTSEKCAQATWRRWCHGQSLTIRVRKTLYISMILSPGIYASTSFSHILSKTLVFHVEKMVKVGIRAVFRVKHHTATMPPRLCLNVKPSAQLYQKKTIFSVSDIMRANPIPCYFTFPLSSSNWKISSGTQPATKLSSLLAVFRSHGEG